MGQSSNFMSNRVGTFMYWENSWVNELNSRNFQTKIIFLQKLIFSFFSDKLFFFFFFNKVIHNLNESVFYKIVKQHRTLKKRNTNLSKKLNLSKVWFIKYRDFIIVSIFCFFLKRRNKLILKYKIKRFSILFRQRKFKKTKKLLSF